MPAISKLKYSSFFRHNLIIQDQLLSAGESELLIKGASDPKGHYEKLTADRNGITIQVSFIKGTAYAHKPWFMVVYDIPDETFGTVRW